MKAINRPTLLINKNICQSNISKMAEKAKRNNLIFRPHFKTHQSSEVGEWFRQEGIDLITVSSVGMARFFAGHGWKNITIAFPCNILEIDDIIELGSTIRLNLLIESVEVAGILFENIRNKTGIFLKIDSGYHRTGIEPENLTLIRAIMDRISNNSKLQFCGFLTHTGQTYHAQGVEEIKGIFQPVFRSLQKLKSEFKSMYQDLIISVGDTPGCSLLDEFPGVDEIRPGNFVFYDLMQFHIGSCEMKDIAVAVICPVVAIHKSRQEAVIYGGAVHLSKEYCRSADNSIIYGMAVEWDGKHWNTDKTLGYLSSLSQEHGILKLNEGISLHPGQLVAIIPVHSCLAADLLKMDQQII
ncbi:MAG: alanine racemase [Bacteroidetes bacterium]|nr:alanine racemase [Bacteroidota bacterium]